jgi:hypothetical protein
MQCMRSMAYVRQHRPPVCMHSVSRMHAFRLAHACIPSRACMHSVSCIHILRGSCTAGCMHTAAACVSGLAPLLCAACICMLRMHPMPVRSCAQHARTSHLQHLASIAGTHLPSVPIAGTHLPSRLHCRHSPPISSPLQALTSPLVPIAGTLRRGAPSNVREDFFLGLDLMQGAKEHNEYTIVRCASHAHRFALALLRCTVSLLQIMAAASLTTAKCFDCGNLCSLQGVHAAHACSDVHTRAARAAEGSVGCSALVHAATPGRHGRHSMSGCRHAGSGSERRWPQCATQCQWMWPKRC